MTQPEHPEYVEAREDARLNSRYPKMGSYTGRMIEIQDHFHDFFEHEPIKPSLMEKWAITLVCIVAGVACIGIVLLFLAFCWQIMSR